MAYFSRTVDTLRRMLSGEQPPVPSLDHEETTDDPADRAAQARRFQRPPFRPQLNAPLSPTDELAALTLHSSSDTDDSDDQVLYATTPIPLSPLHALGPLVPTPHPDRRPSGPPQALQLPKFRPRRPPLPLQRAAPEPPLEPKSARPPLVNPGELPAAARAHQRRFLRQCLHRAGVVDISIWEPVLLDLLSAFAAHVRTDVRAGDALDVRQYVKIKKIPGGRPADSRYVAGIVCTKHLAHRQMPTEIIRPRILLLTRALEYAPDRFLSLSVVLTEERDHLERLIDRVVAVAPTLVLVENGVSNLAQEILWRRGVAFACHVKPHILQQVARLTGARPVTDLDTLATAAVPSPLGTCHSVVVEAYQHRDHPGIRKSYMYFNGCPNANGCSLVLRGPDSIILARVKSVLSMLVFVTYSLRLETRLSRELFARSLPPPAVDVDINGEPDASAVLEPGHRAAAALVPYTTTVLSTTPGVEFPPPYLLVRMRSVEGEYYRVRDEYHRFLLDRSRSTHLTIPSSLLTGNATGVSLTLQEEWANDLRLFHQYENILNDYALDLRAGESFIASHPAPAVDPLFHQNLYVGTTVLRPADRHVCHASEIHLVEYYQESDVSLGQYLEEMCLAPELRCPAPAPSGCGRPLEEHARSYVHGTGQITVTVGPEPPPLPGYADRLLVSSACTVCSRRTPPAVMSAATWQLSFGKFLEMLFYHTDLHCRADLCPHGLNHHHALAFSRGGHTARFRYTPVALAEVRIPALKLVIRSRTNAALKSADAERLRGLITRFWDSLTERLKGFDVWDLVAAERADYCRGDLSELLKIAAAERRYMLQFVDQVTENTHPADTLALNAVRTVVQEKVYDWDARFDQFARAYILPERDLRRNAGRKLRHLFLGQASQAATAGPAEPPTAASAEAPGSASAHTSPRLTARPLPDLGMPSTELRAPTDVMPYLPILGTSDDEEVRSDHAAEDLRWLPHPVNMDATVYRRLSRDWMAESATTSVAPRRETLSTPNTTTANTDDEPAPADVPVPANLPWAGEDTDGVLFPTASTLVPDTHGHLRTPAATALPRPFSVGLRLEGKQAKELANVPGECPVELNDDDDDDDTSSRRGDPLDLSSVPSSPVRTRPLILPEGRPKPAGPFLTKNRPPVGVARRGGVDNRSQLPTPRPSSTADPGLPPPLPASELPPRHASLRTPRPLASPSLLPQPSPSYFGGSARRPPLSNAHPAGAAAVRAGLATNARPKSGTGRQSPHPLDAKWRANVSRVAHRIQATLGRSTDPKQRLNRLFHTTNKLMRKTTGLARPRLELYSTVKDA
ncbi:Mitochondrial distribution and morphology protein 12, partial [Tieghemiomyces parasiticus]